MRCSPEATATSMSGAAKRRTGSNRTVRVPTLQSLTLEQWIEQFRLLREKNQDLLTGKLRTRPGDQRDRNMNAGKPSAQNKRARRHVQAKEGKQRSPR